LGRSYGLSPIDRHPFVRTGVAAQANGTGLRARQSHRRRPTRLAVRARSRRDECPTCGFGGRKREHLHRAHFIHSVPTTQYQTGDLCSGCLAGAIRGAALILSATTHVSNASRLRAAWTRPMPIGGEADGMFWRTEDHPAPHQRPTRSKPGRRSLKGSPRRFLAQPVYPFCDYMSRQRCAYGPGHSDTAATWLLSSSVPPTPLRALRSWREPHVNAENTDAANRCAVRDVPELLGYGTAGRHSHHDYVAVFHLQAVRLRMARAVHLHVARPSKRNALTTRVSRCAAAPSGGRWPESWSRQSRRPGLDHVANRVRTMDPNHAARLCGQYGLRVSRQTLPPSLKFFALPATTPESTL